VQIVSLDRVRVGEVEISNVGAVVMPQALPYVLLGNSFLSRFQMRRDNDVMRLELR
jgi:aspartyl protease family protein